MKKDRLSAALLALALGFIGIHKFYLGSKTAGVLYLVFFWTFIPAILSLIDFACILFLDDAAFDAKYNNSTRQ